MDNIRKIDKRHRLEQEMFMYKITKDNKVLIYWNNKQVVTLSGNRAAKFIEELEDIDEYEAQLLMARVTGSFKYGNERVQKNSEKNKYRR